MLRVFPSLLAADFSNLAGELEKVKNADGLHLDIMDGSFVPNISFGLPIVKSLLPLTSLHFDTHLMIQKPENYVEQFAAAGSDSLSFHIEASHEPEKLLEKIKSLGPKAGIALDLPTAVEKVLPLVQLADFVLVMTVKAGFGGQKFDGSALSKISMIRQTAEAAGKELDIIVDGGINLKTAKEVAAAVANVLVAGSSVFKALLPSTALEELKCVAQK